MIQELLNCVSTWMPTGLSSFSSLIQPFFPFLFLSLSPSFSCSLFQNLSWYLPLSWNMKIEREREKGEIWSLDPIRDPFNSSSHLDKSCVFFLPSFPPIFSHKKSSPFFSFLLFLFSSLSPRLILPFSCDFSFLDFLGRKNQPFSILIESAHDMIQSISGINVHSSGSRETSFFLLFSSSLTGRRILRSRDGEREEFYGYTCWFTYLALFFSWMFRPKFVPISFLHFLFLSAHSLTLFYLFFSSFAIFLGRRKRIERGR